MHARIAGTALWIAVVSLLTACTPGTTPSPSETPGASTSAPPSASESPSSTASPSASASPAAGDPVDVECLDLVSLETMYSFDPNFAFDDSASPAAGSLAATAVAERGVACIWVRETGGGQIVISASKPGATVLESRRDNAGTADGDVYFSLDGDTGVVQVFVGDAWITASSAYFSNSADAAVLTDSVTAALD